MVLQQRFAGAQLGVLDHDLPRHGHQPVGHAIDVRAQPLQLLGDLADLVTHLRQQADDPLVLRRDVRQLGLGQVQLDGEAGGLGAQLVKARALIGQLGLDAGALCLGLFDGIRGQDQVSRIASDDHSAGRQQGHKRDGQSGSSSHQVVFISDFTVPSAPCS